MVGMTSRQPYRSDARDEEWAFVAPYLALLPLDAGQRRHDLREVFNALRYVVRSGAPWRMLPNDLPPWEIVDQQTSRWLGAGVFESMVHDLRALLREVAGRKPAPSAVILDSRTLRSSPESGPRAGHDGAKRKRGSKLHIAVDTLGHLLAAHVTPADEQDREQVGRLAQTAQEATGESVELAYVDQGHTGDQPARDAAEHGLRLCSSCQRPGRASSFCLAAGWSSAPAPGPAASAASSATMSASPNPSGGSTSSPSPASCSKRPLPCWNRSLTTSSRGRRRSPSQRRRASHIVWPLHSGSSGQ
jgi:transposase